MNHKQSAIEKIQKAVPSIMELKFGCEVEIKSDYPKKYYLSKITQKSMLLLTDGKYGEVVVEDNFNILGRPIQLADVLLAMDCGGMKEKNINVGGVIIRSSHQLLILWDLTKDFNSQSEELYKFVDEIL